jgi:hypothetical protein
MMGLLELQKSTRLYVTLSFGMNKIKQIVH